jgi:general secretion pathway protein G
MTDDREHAAADPDDWSSSAVPGGSSGFARAQKLALASLGCGVLVLIALGVLLTLTVRRVLRNRPDANRTKLLADLREIEDALEAYSLGNAGALPDSLDALCVRDSKGKTHLARVPVDPWSRPYVYERALGPVGWPLVVTYGADGLPGGEGPDRDFDNRWLRPR